MEIPIYLAQTAAEFHHRDPVPEHLGWMACHFSPYGTGLSNLPDSLPTGSLVLVNDRTPIHGHDPAQITEEMLQLREQLQPMGFLLDFQRPNCEAAGALAAYLTKELPCPVGVSELYAKGLDCPVFLPPVPPDTPLGEYLAPWNGREIWLEAALDGLRLHISEKGCQSNTFFPGEGELFPHYDESLFCHYRIENGADGLDFFLCRTQADLGGLLSVAAGFGVTMSVGLWQELGTFPNG